MKFNSAKEMLSTITSGVDLYSPTEQKYVFVYNDRDSICEYYIDPFEAIDLERKASETGDYWGAFLGIGGCIYDEDDDYYTPISFCEDYYDSEWIPTIKVCEATVLEGRS